MLPLGEKYSRLTPGRSPQWESFFHMNECLYTSIWLLCDWEDLSSNSSCALFRLGDFGLEKIEEHFPAAWLLLIMEEQRCPCPCSSSLPKTGDTPVWRRYEGIACCSTPLLVWEKSGAAGQCSLNFSKTGNRAPLLHSPSNLVYGKKVEKWGKTFLSFPTWGNGRNGIAIVPPNLL